MSRITSITEIQQLPITLDYAWDFFSNPTNLNKITPSAMRFQIISELKDEKMYAGQIIEYKVRPLLGIPVYWMTEITHIKEKEFFVDEQRKGPFKMWHHQHHFVENNDGVQMIDIVHYQAPLWIVGDIANSLFVKNQVNGIFQYRRKVVGSLFSALEKA